MFKTMRFLAAVSRLEFLPAMASWFTIGFSWGVEPPLRVELVFSAALCFAVIVLSAVVGLQLNSIFDHDLDRMDNRKKGLVQAIDCLGQGRLKLVVAVELLFTLGLVFLIAMNHGSPVLVFMWVVGTFLGYAYSAPPLRLKSRCWLSLGTLLLVLCMFPVLFVFCTFASRLDGLFLLFLVGQGLSVCGLILPTEIRDYFEDSVVGVETVTVRIGLVKASLLSIVFLGLGGLLTGAAFFFRLAYGPQPDLTVFLLVLAVADCLVLRRLWMLHSLSSEYALKREGSKAQAIREFASRAPHWIILGSQSTVFMAIVLLFSKVLL